MTATKVEATEAAEKAAKELGVDLDDVTGTGAEGRITVDDVRAAAPASSGWPAKGYDGPQPWEEGFDLPDPEDQSSAISHRHPILSSGSAGVEVAALCELLERAGYETSFSQGENPFQVLGPSELGAVERFRSDYGVAEDPSGFASPAAAVNHVGPWTWEALERVAAEA